MNHHQLTILDIGAERVAVVPALNLSWHRVRLPAGTLSGGFMAARGGGPRLRAVLEGLLEDQLLDEPSQLHFALQPDARGDEPVWVAVCNRAWLRAALDALEEAGRSPHRLVPEWAPGNPTPAALWLTGDEQAAYLSWVDESGVHGLPVSSGTGAAHGAHSLLATLVPTDILAHAELVAEPGVAQLAEQLLHRDARVVTEAQRLQDTAQTDWNLAQFDMAARNPWLARLALTAETLRNARQWRPARWAVLVLAVVQLVGINAFAWKANTHLEQQRSAIRGIFGSTFPEVTVVVDPPLQMRRAVALLQQSSGSASDSDLETLLGKWGELGAAGSVGSAPTALNFSAGELRLRGPGLNPEQVTALDVTLRAQGLTGQMEGDALVLRARKLP
jgi:general secretion pathway protein L